MRVADNTADDHLIDECPLTLTGGLACHRREGDAGSDRQAERQGCARHALLAVTVKVRCVPPGAVCGTTAAVRMVTASSAAVVEKVDEEPSASVTVPVIVIVVATIFGFSNKTNIFMTRCPRLAGRCNRSLTPSLPSRDKRCSRVAVP